MRLPVYKDSFNAPLYPAKNASQPRQPEGLRLDELSQRSDKGDSRHCGRQSTDWPAATRESTVGVGLEL